MAVLSFLLRLLLRAGLLAAQALLALWFLHAAYAIRMYPIRDFGMIIHEFDPWFNYRAAEYMAEHGLAKFFKWYDYMSWYPLGRPIGTTIYPGMQMAAYAIREAMLRVPPFTYALPNWGAFRWVNQAIRALMPHLPYMPPTVPRKIGFAPMSVNDICCMIPPWFAVLATFFTGCLTYEASRSRNAAVMAMGIMAIIPAHLLRSVGGEFDNEAVAMAAIMLTFWLWLRSVRTPGSWPYALPAGISYWFMVASWGGYIFVINMIGLHAAVLVGIGRFNSGVHRAYTIFFVVGTAGACQVPVVGWQPLRSLEQMGPLLVCLGYQALALCDAERRRRQLPAGEFRRLRARRAATCLVALALVAAVLYPMGYFGPLSARIRGLFVKHTKTGNPLVDSVAEHKPSSSGVYAAHLNLPLDYAGGGALVCLLNRNNGCYFLAVYGIVATHFSRKMSRLSLICGPICAIAAAIWCGFLLDFIVEPFMLLAGKKGYRWSEQEGVEEKAPGASAKGREKGAPASAGGKDRGAAPAARARNAEREKAKSRKARSRGSHAHGLSEWEEELRPGGVGAATREWKAAALDLVPEDLQASYHRTRAWLDSSRAALAGRMALSLLIVLYTCFLSDTRAKVERFVEHCDVWAHHMAPPKVIKWGQDRVKGRVKIDDYWRGYLWIDENTPKDARVMAWWDYGYQITGIAKRTSIADGNTWNHEHIATLGRTLTSPEKKAWNAIRHLADYVLVWAGGQGDDLAKSRHLARIGNSVFPEHCGDGDPFCEKYSFHGPDRSPTPMMANSLLYQLVMHNLAPGVSVSSRLFQEVHTTRNGLMRVFKVMNVSQESKDWVADPRNRVCDAPGSWYCVGQYPPALDKLIAKRRNFAQVEDFNKGGSKSAYTKRIEQEKRQGANAREL